MSEKKTLSRSEIVRQRRRVQTKLQSRPRKRKSRAKSKRSYRELPPITARGVVNDFAIERRNKAGKRRFNAALSLPAVRTLSLPHVHIHVGWRLLSFFLVLLFGTALYLFWTLPEFRVSTAQVTGNQRIPANEINDALGLNGRPVFLLTPDKIREQALQAYPELASVEVTVDLPNIVTVEVSERQALIQWQQDGIYTWIDERGVAFRPRGEASGLIIVQALATPPALSAPEDNPLAPAPFITEEMVEALEALSPYVPPGTPILYTPLTGLSWNDGRGWQAVFGFSSKNVAMKALAYQAMIEWLTQRGIRPTLINVAYPNAPFYRMEPVEVQVEEQ
jgi:hypothetical protein